MKIAQWYSSRGYSLQVEGIDRFRRLKRGTACRVKSLAGIHSDIHADVGCVEQAQASVRRRSLGRVLYGDSV
jgi:hypothetical protein